MEWYYANENDQQIPLDESSLEDLIAIGTIKKTTLVWHDGMGDWKECGQVKPELFAADTTAAKVPSLDGAPNVASSVPSPPPLQSGPPAMPAYYAPPQQDGLAITSLICGIVGLATFWCWGLGIVPSIVAVVTGHLSKKNLPPGGKSPMATAGVIMGWIGLVISLLGVGFLIYLGVTGQLD